MARRLACALLATTTPSGSTTSNEVSALFTRDLARLARQLEALDDLHLWQVLPGVTNSGGNIMLHLSGNLREFIYGHLDRHLGQIDYQRRTLTGDGALTKASA